MALTLSTTLGIIAIARLVSSSLIFSLENSDLTTETWTNTGTLSAQVSSISINSVNSPVITQSDSKHSFQALCFTPTAPCMSVDIDISPSVYTSLSMELYAYQLSVANQHGWIMTNDDGFFDRAIIMHDTYFDCGIAMGVGHLYSAGDCATGYNTMPNDTWTQIIVVWNSNTASLYVDDREPITTNTTLRNAARPYFCMNSNPRFVQQWHGCLAKVSIYDHALTANEIAALQSEYKTTPSPTTPTAPPTTAVPTTPTINPTTLSPTTRTANPSVSLTPATHSPTEDPTTSTPTEQPETTDDRDDDPLSNGSQDDNNMALIVVVIAVVCCVFCVGFLYMMWRTKVMQMKLQQLDNDVAAASISSVPGASPSSRAMQREQIDSAQGGLQNVHQDEEVVADEEPPGAGEEGMAEGADQNGWTNGEMTERALAIDQDALDVIRQWLQDTVGLSEYYGNFVENGFERMDFIKEIKETEELFEIGITDKLHQQRILTAIANI